MLRLKPFEFGCRHRQLPLQLARGQFAEPRAAHHVGRLAQAVDHQQHRHVALRRLKQPLRVHHDRVGRLEAGPVAQADDGRIQRAQVAWNGRGRRPALGRSGRAVAGGGRDRAQARFAEAGPGAARRGQPARRRGACRSRGEPRQAHHRARRPLGGDQAPARRDRLAQSGRPRAPARRLRRREQALPGPVPVSDIPDPEVIWVTAFDEILPVDIKLPEIPSKRLSSAAFDVT